nr:MAG TPA: hypothetical protein [Caudoviricetes sp.]DAR74453.1 MAG TPA: hypothetical protein [Caudoviricetes sp.]
MRALTVNSLDSLVDHLSLLRISAIASESP